MYKNFKSNFSVLCEENTQRNTQGGFLVGDFCVINKSALENECVKARASNFADVVKSLIDSDLPLKIAAVKSERPESQHDLYGAGSLVTRIWVDVVQEYAPGLWKNPVTLPAEVVDVIFPEGNNWSPSHPESWKYANKVQIKPKKVKAGEGEMEKQTSGNKRDLPTTDTAGITKGSAKDPKIQKPKEYKESEQTDSEVLAEMVGSISRMSEEPPEVETEKPELSMFQRYGIYAKHYDNLTKKASQNELTPNEKLFFDTFSALLSGEASVNEMKAAHKAWMEEEDSSEADKVKDAYLTHLSGNA